LATLKDMVARGDSTRNEISNKVRAEQAFRDCPVIGADGLREVVRDAQSRDCNVDHGTPSRAIHYLQDRHGHLHLLERHDARLAQLQGDPAGPGAVGSSLP
jgi:hypothetical protein